MTTAPTGSAFLQLLVAGIGTGSIYALIALGFNVVFKSTGAMNFAQGEWVVMGGMISALLLGSFSSVGVACLFAVLLVAVFGLISERLVIWPLRRPTPLLITLVSIGLSICTRSLVISRILGRCDDLVRRCHVSSTDAVDCRPDFGVPRHHALVLRAQHAGQGAPRSGG